MISPQPPIRKSSAFLVLFGLAFVLFGWFVFGLTLSNAFLFPLVLTGAILTLLLALVTGAKFIFSTTLDFKIAILVSLMTVLLLSHFSVPTLFSGRDQGSIAEAAFRLAHTGHLAFSSPLSDSFFQIYGPGTALNFPGFAYTQSGALITQFPLGYTSWLAAFVSLCGSLGPVVGNGVLFFLFLITLYALLRTFAHPLYAFSGLALTLGSFLPTWFAKITLSENLALFLFVFLVWNLILFLKEGKFVFYAGILLSGGLLAFTRIEGFAFLGIAFIILFFSRATWHIWKTYPWKSLVFPGLVFIFIFLRDFFINLPYYKMIGKALFKFGHQLGAGSVTGDLAATGGSFTLSSVFFLYGLLILFVFGFCGLIVFIKERRLTALLPTLIALPTFLYLFDPNISLDYPWMLRRYLFSIFPTLLFSAVVGIALFFSKEKFFPIPLPQGKRLLMVSSIFLGLLAFQYSAWSTALPYAENRGLLDQITAFSQGFSENDLVLVDRNATGDGFAMLSGPAQYLLAKNMVYFFNPDDLNKLDTHDFAHVYLLVPQADQARYVSAIKSPLVYKKTVTFSLEQFENLSLEHSASTTLRLPNKITKETHDTLFQIR